MLLKTVAHLTIEHLTVFEVKFKRYFPEISSQTFRFLRKQSIAPATPILCDIEAVQADTLGLHEGSDAKMKFDTETLTDGRYLP